MIQHSEISFFLKEDKKIAFQLFNKNRLNDSSAPLIVFLHEGLGSIAQWKLFPRTVCEKLNLPGLVYDRPGYGKSSPVKLPIAKDYHEQESKNILPSLLEHLNIDQKVILFGHSDGGTIALLFAAYFPEKTLAVISEAGHVFVEEITLKGIFQAIESYKEGKFQKLLEKYHGNQVASTFYGWADIWLSEEFRDWNIEKTLPAIQASVLVIQGENDEYGTLGQVESILKHVSGSAEKWIVPDCGHAPHLEKEEAVVEKIVSFIQKVLS